MRNQWRYTEEKTTHTAVLLASNNKPQEISWHENGLLVRQEKIGEHYHSSSIINYENDLRSSVLTTNKEGATLSRHFYVYE